MRRADSIVGVFVVAFGLAGGCTASGSYGGNKVPDTATPSTLTTVPGTPGGSPTTGTTTTGGSPTGSTTGTGTGTGTATGNTTTPTGASCNVSVPADAIVVSTDGPQTVDGATYWVCPQTVLSFSGTNALIIVDASADVLLNGSGNTVWLQSNSDLAAFADGNLFVYESGAVIDDQSTNGNPTQVCSTIDIDTTLAPVPGC